MTKSDYTITLALEDVTRYRCPDCDQLHDEGDLEPSYECPECGQVFSRSNSYSDNHQCPQCLKFSSKQTDQGCPDCGTECEAVELVECPVCDEALEVEELPAHLEGHL